jgi:putative PIN family toxin of toxin-antitoxin system
MLIVVDTNVLVSALWTRNGNPAQILSLIQSRKIIPCYDCRILQEYHEVLSRPKFGFDAWEVTDLLAQIEDEGKSVIAEPLDIMFTDESDRKFYEAAKHCGAYLITGNQKHFPEDEAVLSPSEFLEEYMQQGN